MEYTFKFNSYNYDDEETFVNMIETIIHLLSSVHPDMIDLACDFKKQLVSQCDKVTHHKIKDKDDMMELFDECAMKNTDYTSLKALCDNTPSLGAKAYDAIYSGIGDALGPFAYIIHEYHVVSWMYELIDIYENNWDWNV